MKQTDNFIPIKLTFHIFIIQIKFVEKKRIRKQTMVRWLGPFPIFCCNGKPIFYGHSMNTSITSLIKNTDYINDKNVKKHGMQLRRSEQEKYFVKLTILFKKIDNITYQHYNYFPWHGTISWAFILLVKFLNFHLQFLQTNIYLLLHK